MSVAVKSRVDNKNARHVHRAKRYRCAWKPNHKNVHIHINSPRAYVCATKGRLKKYIIYTARVRLFYMYSIYIYVYILYAFVRVDGMVKYTRRIDVGRRGRWRGSQGRGLVVIKFKNIVHWPLQAYVKVFIFFWIVVTTCCWTVSDIFHTHRPSEVRIWLTRLKYGIYV